MCKDFAGGFFRYRNLKRLVVMSETNYSKSSGSSAPDNVSGVTTFAGRGIKLCFFCGALEEPGKKLLRCSGCLTVFFCNSLCQKAAWKQHKEQCTRCRKVDVHIASPLLAAMAFLPRMQTSVKMLCYEVHKRELRGRELHLYLRNRGPIRESPSRFDVSGRIREGPSPEQLHNMVQHDGYLEAIVVGTMYGFHCAVQQYNNRGQAAALAGGSSSVQPAPQNPLDYVTLVHHKSKIIEYGIAIGSTCPDYTLVYHIGNKVRQLQDPANHVWMYFRTERSDRLYVDVGSLAYGMGLMLDVIRYLPDGTPESQVKYMTPVLGAPANVVDRSDLASLERAQPGAARVIRENYLANRQRIPVSNMPADVEPEVAIRQLLQRLREAVAAGAPVQAAAAETAAVMGMVAAAAVVTAAAVAVAPCLASAGGPTQTGGVSNCSPSRTTGHSSGGSSRRRIPFRDSSLDKHVARAMLHFECSFNNTHAVLEQGTYKSYPTSLHSVCSFASWVNTAKLGI